MDENIRMPLARDEGLLVEELGDELLVYDLDRDRAHCLSATAAKVWRHCDGRTTPAGLQDQVGLSTALIAQALEELDGGELLVAPVRLDGSTRRELGVKIVKVAGVAATLPLVASITAPAAAQSLTPVANCARFTSDNGCGSCHRAGCCCCNPGGGPAKSCVPNQAFCSQVQPGANCTTGGN